MNFNSFNCNLRNYRENKKLLPIWVPELYKKLKPLFDEYVKEATDFFANVKSYGLATAKEKVKFSGYKKFLYKFKTFMDVSLTIMKDYCNSTKAYFKYAKYKPISHGCFHNWKKFFTRLIYRKSIIWTEHFDKSTRPNTIYLKYSKRSRNFICNKYYSYDPKDPDTFQNFTTFWGQLVNKEILSDVDDFSSITQQTLRKILSQDPRFKPKPQKPEKNHPFRDKPKESGHAQMDLKIFGEKQTGLGRFIASFDCICTQTRIPFSTIVDPADAKHLIEAIEQARLFYESLGIKLTLIRTDNAMFFKRNNFVVSDLFNDWCIKHHIHHQFIPLGEPEADGCVERYHKDMDDILVPKLVNMTDVKSIAECVKKFSHWATYHRYVHFNELKDLPTKQQYMKPIDAIKFFKTYKK